MVNISGGDIGDTSEAQFGSVVNISGGTVGTFFDALPGSVVNISGGNIGRSFQAHGPISFSQPDTGSDVNISGGTFGRSFIVEPGSDVELIGGEFQLNGAPFSEPTYSTPFNVFDDVLTGTLADGSAFIFSTQGGDRLGGVQLTSVALPALDLSTIVVATSDPDRPSGLRPGQTMRLIDGGELGEDFEVANATLNVEGGTIGDFAGVANGTVNISGGTVGGSFTSFNGSVVNISGGDVGVGFSATAGSVVNISGGDVGSSFDAGSGSEVNITGGSVGFGFEASSDSVVNISGGNFGGFLNVLRFSEVNLFGSDYVLDGQPLDSLNMGETMTIDDRDVVLTGVFADGSPFSFNILPNGNRFSGGEVISPDATFTVTLGPPLPDVTLGDADQNSVVDFADIPAFIAILQAGTFLPEADINQDGVVDFDDIPAFIEILTNA